MALFYTQRWTISHELRGYGVQCLLYTPPVRAKPQADDWAYLLLILEPMVDALEFRSHVPCQCFRISGPPSTVVIFHHDKGKTKTRSMQVAHGLKCISTRDMETLSGSPSLTTRLSSAVRDPFSFPPLALLLFVPSRPRGNRSCRFCVDVQLFIHHAALCVPTSFGPLLAFRWTIVTPVLHG